MKPFDPRLLRHARSARPFIAATVAAGVGTTACIVLQGTALAGVISQAFAQRSGVGAVAAPLALLAALAATRSVLAWAAEAATQRSATAIISELRSSLVARAAEASLGRTGGSSGELAVLATTGLDALDPYFSRFVPQLVLAVLSPLAIVAWIAPRDFVAAVIIALTVPLVPLMLALVGMATRRRAESRLQALATLGNHFLDVVQGLPTLRAFRRGRAQLASIREVSDRFREETMATLRVAFLSSLVGELMATIATALVAVAVGLRLANGQVAFSTALTVLILTPEAFLPLRQAGAQFHASADGVAAARRVLDELDRPAASGGGAEPAPDLGTAVIRLEDVTVTDADRPAPALDRVDLEIRPGERIAVVGPSGAGKSTLLGALLGFTPLAGGRIVVESPDGHVQDLVSIDRDRWRAQIAWVPQDPRLTTGTIADNVRLGRSSATDAELVWAMDAAALGPTLARLPDGAATQVGEGGLRLSAGERQRVALARAFLKDAPLLLLDEPTSGLDLDTEAAIDRALRQMARDRTIVVVAHRLRLAHGADRIVRIDHGRLGTATGETASETSSATLQAEAAA